MASTQPDAYVRPALKGDTDRIGQIHVASWSVTHAQELGPDVIGQFDARQFAEQWALAVAETTGPAHAVLVACAGGDVVGFAALQPSPDPDAPEDGSAREVSALFVDPEHWREGHGSRLLAACADLAGGRGGATLWTWATEGDTARAGFLAAAGFEADGASRTMAIDEERTLTERRFATAL